MSVFCTIFHPSWNIFIFIKWLIQCFNNLELTSSPKWGVVIRTLTSQITLEYLNWAFLGEKNIRRVMMNDKYFKFNIFSKYFNFYQLVSKHICDNYTTFLATVSSATNKQIPPSNSLFKKIQKLQNPSCHLHHHYQQSP